MNLFNSKNEKIRQCKISQNKKKTFAKIFFDWLFSVKGFIERIDDNDDPKQRTSQRTSLQPKMHKNVKYSIRLIDDNQILDHVLPNELQ